jgi:DNA-binding beta-propeller fold protein YncE
MGHQVFKYSPDGKLLMTLGKPGGGRDAEYFYQPNAVFVAPDGSIFVSEGHSSAEGSTARVLKFDAEGKLLKSWGKLGKGNGEFDQPHALAMDSQGRLFVADRGNNRIQIFDQEGNFLAEWTQFSRISGLAIDRASGDTLYAADSESGSVNPAHGAWRRGIRIGSAKDGSVQSLIPDSWKTCAEGQRPTPDAPCATNTSSAEGIAVDREGNIYGAEVGQRAIKKYVKK